MEFVGTPFLQIAHKIKVDETKQVLLRTPGKHHTIQHFVPEGMKIEIYATCAAYSKIPGEHILDPARLGQCDAKFIKLGEMKGAGFYDDQGAYSAMRFVLVVEAPTKSLPAKASEAKKIAALPDVPQVEGAVELNDMTMKDLRILAKQLNLNTFGMGKQKIVDSLATLIAGGALGGTQNVNVEVTTTPTQPQADGPLAEIFMVVK